MTGTAQDRLQAAAVRGFFPGCALGIVMAGLLCIAAASGAWAQTYTVLYSFQCGTDGAHPYSGLIQDKFGDLFGTTYYGGTFGKGTVFELTAAGAESVLYDFTGNTDGGYPSAGLVPDAHGNVYGTTVGGGTSGQGVVFKLSRAGAETVLYDFTGGSSGGSPDAGLAVDPQGNFYGTTVNGGANGLGTVFKLTPSGVHSVLYSFVGTDGANPEAGLVRDTAGNLYGTTLNGGASGHGVVFKVTVSGSESVLHDFAGSPQTVPLTGMGTAVQLIPASLNFGSQGVGTTSAPQMIKLTNLLAKTLTISNLAITGANAGDFAETNTCGSSLAPKAACTIGVTFTPTAAGIRTASVSVSDDGGGSPQAIPLAGLGN